MVAIGSGEAGLLERNGRYARAGMRFLLDRATIWGIKGQKIKSFEDGDCP